MSNNTDQLIDNNDLIFYSSGENIFSGGFSVDSMIMKGGKSPMKSISVSDDNSHGIFGKNLAVPPMWFLSPKKNVPSKKNNFEAYQNDDQVGNIVEEDLHEQLLKISQINERKKKTAKLPRKKANKQTKKRKN